MLILNTPYGFLAPKKPGDFQTLKFTPDADKAVQFDFWTDANSAGWFLVKAQYITSYLVLSTKSD